MNKTSGGGIAMWHILSHMQLSIQSLLKLLNRLKLNNVQSKSRVRNTPFLLNAAKPQTDHHCSYRLSKRICIVVW